jgi:hypothetical protein
MSSFSESEPPSNGSFSCHGYGDQHWDPIVVHDDPPKPPLGSALNPVVIGGIKKKKKKTHPFHADTYRQKRKVVRQNDLGTFFFF